MTDPLIESNARLMEDLKVLLKNRIAGSECRLKSSETRCEIYELEIRTSGG